MSGFHDRNTELHNLPLWGQALFMLVQAFTEKPLLGIPRMPHSKNEVWAHWPMKGWHLLRVPCVQVTTPTGFQVGLWEDGQVLDLGWHRYVCLIRSSLRGPVFIVPLVVAAKCLLCSLIFVKRKMESLCFLENVFIFNWFREFWKKHEGFKMTGN